MTVPGVGFGMRRMTAPLHAGQCVGRRGGPEASAMSSSVGGPEAAHKSRSRPDGHASDTVEHPCRARQFAIGDDVVALEIDGVLWPVSFIATRSGMPTRTMFRTAVRRRSGGMRPGHPAATQAAAHAFVNALMGRGAFGPLRPLATIRKNTEGRCGPSA